MPVVWHHFSESAKVVFMERLFTSLHSGCCSCIIFHQTFPLNNWLRKLRTKHVTPWNASDSSNVPNSFPKSSIISTILITLHSQYTFYAGSEQDKPCSCHWSVTVLVLSVFAGLQHLYRVHSICLNLASTSLTLAGRFQPWDLEHHSLAVQTPTTRH